MDVRLALPDEVEAICEFGATYIPQHYGPLLGAELAKAQVDNWWTIERMSKAVNEGRVVVAEEDRDIIGVGEWSLYEGTPDPTENQDITEFARRLLESLD